MFNKQPVMNDDSRFWIWITGIVATFLLGSIQTCARYDINKAKVMTASGYEETTQPGTSTTFWKKAKP